MAAPEIEAIYPNDEATGVPIAADIAITFSNGIDLSTAKNNIIVWGPDFDVTSGPESASWIKDKNGNNPHFLKSPGFKGIVDCDYELVYVDGDGEEIDPTVTTVDEEETGDGTDAYRHKIKISPKQGFAPDAEYKVYVIGDAEDGTSRGVSCRTVFDVDSSSATTTDGVVYAYGGYTGTIETTINIKVTTAGDIGTAKYKWWYSGDGEASATTGKVTSRRYRKLGDGVQIRFSGSDFIADDEYTIAVQPTELLAESYTFSFSAGDGSISEIPSTASTSVIGTETSLTSDSSYLEIESMDPEDGATHQNNSTKKITITFSADIDEETVDDDSVTIYKWPVSGIFDGPSGTNSDNPEELLKKLTVDGDKLIIEI